MQTISSTVIVNGKPEERQIHVYYFDEFTQEQINHFPINSDIDREGFDYDIRLRHCPFCGWTGRLNRDPIGWYGWCSMCGTEGPKHHEWYKAARMWNNRTLETIAKERNIDFNTPLRRDIDSTQFDDANREYFEYQRRN